MPLTKPRQLGIGEALVGSTLLGGLFGLMDGGSQTMYQQTIPTRPTFAPEEEALRNYYINLAYQNVGAQSPLSNWILQYYGVPTSTIPMTTTTTGTPSIAGQTLREQYETPIKTQVAAQERAKTDPLVTLLTKWRESGTPEDAREQIMNLGYSNNDARKIMQEFYRDPVGTIAGYTQTATQAQTTQPLGSVDYLNIAKQAVQSGDYTKAQEYLNYAVGKGTPTTEMPTQTATWQPQGPLAEILNWTPERRKEAFNLMRSAASRQLGDWYQRGRRELSQLGIARGGLMGSAVENNLLALLGEGGRRETDIMNQIAMSEYAAERQEPLTLLQTLEDLRRWEESNKLAQQQPFLGIGQQIIGAPWGQNVATTQTQPGIGILPGAIAGAGAATNILGTYGLGQQLGWWGGGSTQLPSLTTLMPYGTSAPLFGI